MHTIFQPNSRQPRGGLPLLYTAIGIAFIIWYFLFAVDGTPFWIVIAAATFTLGGCGLFVFPDTLKANGKQWLKFIGLGVAFAVVLYFIFAVGYQIAKLLPFGPDQVEGVYSTREQASPSTIAALLLFPIGPGEELFWRAWVQRAFSMKYGPWKGFLLSLFFYTVVHLSSLNLTLIAAATVAGAVWGLLYMKVGHIGPGVISHALWDATVFVWLPFT
ncbi:CPBP family intramembrane metalloprotease [bacterium]|nr:CPBP family intramembrane metalloprotease [bacterium]